MGDFDTNTARELAANLNHLLRLASETMMGRGRRPS